MESDDIPSEFPVSPHDTIDRLEEEKSRLSNWLIRERERRMAAEAAKHGLIEENDALVLRVRELEAELRLRDGSAG